ncbi:transmembrane protein 70 homolog, mitochondrial-like [Tubulanus polymorphus]|uniref:transmembrane protein 70 homolog, mitochondrial-like n=1 Tax=Tubulanus polymorphus TaxID=672921 RepID=UPI003DA4E994
MHIARIGLCRLPFVVPGRGVMTALTLTALNNTNSRITRRYFSSKTCDSVLATRHVTSVGAGSIAPAGDRFVSTKKITYRRYCVDKPSSSVPLIIDDKYGELVYEGGIASMVRGVKFFSLSTSILGLSLQPYILLNADQLGKFTVLFGGICSFFILGTPILLHWITKKYVTQLYLKRDTGEFTALTVTFFMRTMTTKFRAEDVKVPEIPGLFTTAIAKGRPLFMDMNFFRDIEVYKHMMGYDKPVDWSFPDDIKKYYEKENK